MNDVVDHDPSKSVPYILGRIEAGLDVIKQTLSENRTADAQYRTGIRAELHEHTERIQKIEAAQTVMQSNLSEVVPTVKALEAQKNQAVGVMHLSKWIYTLIAGGIGAGLLSIFQSFFGHLH